MTDPRTGAIVVVVISYTQGTRHISGEAEPIKLYHDILSLGIEEDHKSELLFPEKQYPIDDVESVGWI